MRVLLLSASGGLSRKRLQEHLDRLDLGPGAPDVQVGLVLVRPPKRRLPVGRIDVVEPSVLPFVPLVPVAGPGVETWGGVRRLVVRGLRVARRGWTRVPLPEAARLSPRSFLTVAALTSPGLRRLAAQHDVVVALDNRAALPAWLLARRVPGPAFVHRPENVRAVLERLERLEHLQESTAPTAPVAEGTAEEVSEEDERAADLPGTRMPDLGPEAAAAPRRVLIGPANYAGQGTRWMRAVREHCPGTAAMSMRVGVPRFPVDYLVDGATYNGDLDWRLAWREFVTGSFTHVIAEANVPLLGGGIIGTGERHVVELQRAGLEVALLSHGSDARVPSLHAARERWHSYDALSPSKLRHLEQQASTNVEWYNRFDGTVFVSTPGIQAFVPRGVWLPVVIDPGMWAVPRESRPKPVVAHIPSSAQKGTHLIDPVLSGMQERGAIDYLRLEGVPHEQMPALYGSADIMVEQFGIADYSVAACEAMAAGCVVVSRVADEVRETVRDATGLDLPVVEANPETLEEVILGLMSDRGRMQELGEQGRAFVAAVHDGRRSAAVLGDWLTAHAEGAS